MSWIITLLILLHYLSTVNSSVHIGQVILTTLFLGKPPSGSSPVLNLVYVISPSLITALLESGKRKNSRRNILMTEISRKNVPDVGVDLCVACIQSSLTTDQAVSLPTKQPHYRPSSLTTDQAASLPTNQPHYRPSKCYCTLL